MDSSAAAAPATGAPSCLLSSEPHTLFISLQRSFLLLECPLGPISSLEATSILGRFGQSGY